MSAFIELVLMIALMGLLDWGDLRNSSKTNRYVYSILVFVASAAWVYISLVYEVPRIGNFLEKLTI